MNEERYIKAFQIVVIAAAGILIIALATAWILSGPAQEWRHVQQEFKNAWADVADSLENSTPSGRNEIKEYQLDELGRVDRCITCHEGMENPFMLEAEHPFRTHPGDFLKDHPVEKYGCTVCHGGQGRALNKTEAHATDPSVHWEKPLLSQPYIQSACGQCHLSVFDENVEFAGAEVFRRGHEIFKREGCLGCHRARGVGGIVGPDLTEQGEKTRHDYSFENIALEQSVPNWLKEHFRDPEMVSPGSQMLKIDLPEEDLVALTTFVLGLAKPDIAFEYFSLNALKEFKGNRHELDGGEIFSLACSACHGKEGKGKSYKEYRSGAPAIRSVDFLRVASSDFIRFTLLKGRSRRQMASWMTDISGLKEDEITGLIAYLEEGDEKGGRALRKVLMLSASADRGANLFSEYCVSCHGQDGGGGIALALNRVDFLRNADNTFLYSTIMGGRGNATMPSWEYLEQDEIYDLVKYLRSFQAYAPQNRTVKFAMNDAEKGKLNYHFLCSRCHGESGQGQTGPAIINADFLDLASDAFLYSTISSGREHTAMFGWSADVYNSERLDIEDIGNIITFIREEAGKSQAYVFAGANPGDKERGRPLFDKHCAECHGSFGEGKMAPALNNQELLSAASNGHLMASITIGRRGTEMPEWGRETAGHIALSGRDRQDIVAFIRNWERVRIGF